MTAADLLEQISAPLLADPSFPPGWVAAFLERQRPVFEAAITRYLLPVLAPPAELPPAEILRAAGLRVVESTTTPKKTGKKPRPVWLVSGAVDGWREQLYALGGSTRFTGRSTFSFFDDPTDALADLVQKAAPLSFAEQEEVERQRAAARSERLEERADNARAAAGSYTARAWKALDGIEPGQPILVGHHSERHHRAAHGRADSAMRHAVDESRKAEDLDARARGAARNAAPYTVEYLGNRIEEDEAEARRLERSGGSARAKQETAERLVHWRSELEKLGGVPFGPDVVKVGDLVRYSRQWFPVRRSNKKTVQVGNWLGVATLTFNIPWTKITGHKPAAKEKP